MADEDLPPPLEDMTEVINRISELKAKVDNHVQQRNGPIENRIVSNNNSQNKTTSSNATPQTVKPKVVQPPPSQPSTGACGFGGMKKGFLSGGLDNKKPPAATAAAVSVVSKATVQPVNGQTQDNMPHIKANPKGGGDHLVMEEVQKMREQLQKTDAWLTEDLLNKLGNNDKLMAMMADPRCERALQEFQANPDKALLTYQHDKYIQEFFKEFCDVLGNHYENLNDASLSVAAEQVRKNSSETAAPPTTERREELIKEVKTTRHSTQQKPVNQKSAAQIKKEAEEDARVKQVLQDPKLVDILQSPNIMELIRSLKEDPEKAQRLLQQGGKEFQEKVKVLVDAGLLAFQR